MQWGEAPTPTLFIINPSTVTTHALYLARVDRIVVRGSDLVVRRRDLKRFRTSQMTPRIPRPCYMYIQPDQSLTCTGEHGRRRCSKAEEIAFVSPEGLWEDHCALVPVS